MTDYNQLIILLITITKFFDYVHYTCLPPTVFKQCKTSHKKTYERYFVMNVL